jgi:hypothetical protein
LNLFIFLFYFSNQAFRVSHTRSPAKQPHRHSRVLLSGIQFGKCSVVWIPACAGMTVYTSTIRSNGIWIPSYAGMTARGHTSSFFVLDATHPGWVPMRRMGTRRKAPSFVQGGGWGWCCYLHTTTNHFIEQINSAYSITGSTIPTSTRPRPSDPASGSP